jgi:hypothetical protein
MRTALLFALVVAAAPALPGEPAGRVTLTINAHGAGAAAAAVVLSRIGTADGQAVHVIVPGEAEKLVELPAGSWALDVENPSLWHVRQHLYVPPAGKVEMTIDVWPRSELAGTVVPTAKGMPQAVIVRFESASPRQPPVLSDAPFAGELRCPIAENAFRCAIPTGTFNLRLRPKGFIAQYRTQVAFVAGQTQNLGAFAFREGQSITGGLELPAKFDADVRDVIVTAAPAVAAAAAPSAVAGATLLPLSAKGEKNGFFHIDGVPAGAYVVRAAYKRALYSDAVEVEVRAAREAELIEPLRLNVPHRIEATLLPPLTPAREPWHVRLSRYVGERQLDPITESNADTDGDWESAPLPPGRYSLSIGTVEGDVWSDEPIVLEASDHHSVVTLVRSGLHGSVTLGDQPLQAALTFTNSSGLNVRAQSNEQGRFSLNIAQSKDRTLTVRIDAEQPIVRRRIQVEAPADAERDVTIRLPASVLLGNVIDAHGLPADDADVYITGGGAGEAMVQTRTAADGSFAIHALSAGKYSLVASSFLMESTPVEVELRSDETPDPVGLVLRPMSRLRGRVVSPAGGVPGASIQAWAVDVEQRMAATRTTDANGDFDVAVPPGARTFEVTIAPPGFSYVITSAALSDRPTVIGVDQRGGTLRLHAPAQETPYIVHNGATTPANAVAYSWPVRTEASGDGTRELVMPMMEPGSYSACLVASLSEFRKSGGNTGGRCVSGFLAPLGSLTLDLSP